MNELNDLQVQEVNGGILPALWAGAKVVAAIGSIAGGGYTLGYALYSK